MHANAITAPSVFMYLWFSPCQIFNQLTDFYETLYELYFLGKGKKVGLDGSRGHQEVEASRLFKKNGT
jgi:hypothetical protein